MGSGTLPGTPRPAPPLPAHRDALRAYQEVLTYAPNNKVAVQRSDFCKTRVERLGV